MDNQYKDVPVAAVSEPYLAFRAGMQNVKSLDGKEALGAACRITPQPMTR